MNKLFNINSLTLIVTVFSLAWAVWSGYLGLKPHSLEFKLVSQVAIQPKETGTISGIQVTVDGTQVESPYLSVLELTNNGRKPIPKSDFEAPLELRAGSGVMVIRAQVTATNPKDIEAHLEAAQDVVTLSPLLLNSDDTLTISVLTAGKPPAFTPRARIADISTLSLSDGTKNASSLFEITLLSILILGLLLSSSCIDTIISRRNGVLDVRSAYLIYSTTLGTTVYAMMRFFYNVSNSSDLNPIAAYVLLFIVYLLLTYLWNRKPKSDATKNTQ